MKESKEQQYAPLRYEDGGMIVDKDGCCFAQVFGTELDQVEIGSMIVYRFNDHDFQQVVNNQQEEEINILKRDAKFARDHSPKFKTLEWITNTGFLFYAKAEISFGTYEVSQNQSLWGPDFWGWAFNGHFEKCIDKEEAFKQAQSDYEVKLKALLK